jgi:hypothetical protein
VDKPRQGRVRPGLPTWDEHTFGAGLFGMRAGLDWYLTGALGSTVSRPPGGRNGGDDMSVTWGPEINKRDHVEWFISHWDEEAVDTVPMPGAPDLTGLPYGAVCAIVESWYEAEGLTFDVRCDRGISLTSTVPAVAHIPTVNVANSNARELLMVLGLPMDDDGMCGREHGEVFLARVLMALAEDRLDDERPTWEDTGQRGARVIHCGRRAGYVTDTLQRLAEVARGCYEANRYVTWF